MIIKESAILFASKGYYGVGLAEILVKCNIPKGSFYYYFPNGKKQLMQEVLTSSYDYMENYIKENYFINENAEESFTRMIDSLIYDIKEKKEYFASLLLTMISIESVYLDATLNETCQIIYDRWKKLYYNYLNQCGYNNDSSNILCQCIFSLIHAALITSWIKQDASDLINAKVVLNKILTSY